MLRDIRDPQEIGAALEAQRAHSPGESITSLADRVLGDPTIRNYDESNGDYADRIAESQGYHRNGQLAMFKAA